MSSHRAVGGMTRRVTTSPARQAGPGPTSVRVRSGALGPQTGSLGRAPEARPRIDGGAFWSSRRPSSWWEWSGDLPRPQARRMGVVSMDPNRYEVSEPELLLRKLRATVAFAFTDDEPRCRRQAACSNVLWDPDSFGLSGRLAVSGDLLIVRSIPQQVVDDHEERMRHRHRGALLASISGDPAELPR
jgi:hypothetical protein